MGNESRTRNVISINGDKLKSELKKRKLNGSTVSLELGYSKGYLSVCMGNNQISKVATIALDKMYNIPLSNYESSEGSEISSEMFSTLNNKLDALENKIDSILAKLQHIDGRIADINITKTGNFSKINPIDNAKKTMDKNKKYIEK